MGPLPQFYRFTVIALLLTLSLAAGVWLAGYLRLPLGGLGVGLAAGLLLVWLVSHDFTSPTRRTVRVPRRR